MAPLRQFGSKPVQAASFAIQDAELIPSLSRSPPTTRCKALAKSRYWLRSERITRRSNANSSDRTWGALCADARAVVLGYGEAPASDQIGVAVVMVDRSGVGRR